MRPIEYFIYGSAVACLLLAVGAGAVYGVTTGLLAGIVAGSVTVTLYIATVLFLWYGMPVTMETFPGVSER